MQNSERTNLISEFFNSKSDANQFLEASSQEIIENDFQNFMLREGEKHALDFVNEICIESISPELFEKWEEIKSALKSNRAALKRYGYAV